MNEKEMIELVWATRYEVNKDIEWVSERAYTLQGRLSLFKKPNGEKSNKHKKEKFIEYTEDPCFRTPEPENGHPTTLRELDSWAKAIEVWAKKLQLRTELVEDPTLLEILRMRDRAGLLLGAIERLTHAFELLRNPPSPPPPKTEAASILSRLLVIVFTARDQIIATKGHLRTATSRIGRLDAGYPLIFLIVVAIFYIGNHPTGGLYPLPVPRIWFEIFFWSLIGAVSHALVRIATDTLLDRYDPATRINMVWKIPLAPVFAFAVLLLMDFFGITLGQGLAARVLSPVDPNYPVIWLVSFLAGYFSRKALNRLEEAARALFGGKLVVEPAKP